jgi:two-component system OmpR family sensor kinase/two-component system sensor histidine kinase BaeS
MLLFALACGGFTALFWFAASLLGRLDLPRGAINFGIIPLVFIFAGLFVALHSLRRVAMPIGDVMEAASRVAEGDYSARVAERGPREVRALAHAFNAMVARLQASDKQRRNLLADVTHELRTPLTVIQGNLEGLLDGVYPRDDAHLVPILEETRVLSRLIDDLRTLALAESGALKLQTEPTDLATLTSETVASFRVQADAAGIELSAEVSADAPMLELDPARIRQVLENLIANALRYTPRGGTVRVEYSCNATHVTVSVSDTGAGIPPDDLPHIFERFYKARDSRGAGLGLAIAKNLIAAHAGEMFAQSELGKGTTIRFRLPLAT